MNKIKTIELEIRKDNSLWIPCELVQHMNVEAKDKVKIFIVDGCMVIMSSAAFGEKILKN